MKDFDFDFGFDFDSVMDEIDLEYTKYEKEHNDYMIYLYNRQIVLYINDHVYLYSYINILIFCIEILINFKLLKV